MSVFRIAVLLLVAGAVCSVHAADKVKRSHIDAIRAAPPDTAHEPVAFQRYVQSYLDGKCYVHRIAMARRFVPVTKDLSRAEKSPDEAVTALFPFAPTVWIVAGDSKVFDGVDQIEMFSCPDCETARRIWTRYYLPAGNAQEPMQPTRGS